VGLLDGQKAGLLFQIKGDATDAIKAFNSVETKIGKLSKDSAGLGSVLSGLINPTTAFVGGITALASAAVLGTVALFDLSKQAAEYGSAIFDASEKTGLHAETLSAMKLAADQSSSSLDEVTSGIAKFSKQVGAAADGSEKAAAALKDLGIDPAEALQDLDASLAKVFKRISDAKPGIEQITLAQKAFGKAGADLLPFIKSFDGDLEGLTKRAKELGVTINDQAAREADEFGDTLDQLSAQMAGLARQIVSPLIPQITNLTKALSKLLVDNQAAMSRWQTEAKSKIEGVIGYWEDLTKAVNGYFTAIEKNKSNNPYSIPIPGIGLRGPLRDRLVQGANDALIDRGQKRQAATTDLVRDNTSIFKFPTEGEKAERAAEAEKAAEEMRKKREAAAKRDLETQSQYIDLQIKAIREHFQEVQAATEKAYLARELTEDQFIAKSNKDLAKYSEDTSTYLSRAFDIDSKGKNADEILNLQLAKTQAIAAIGRDIGREQEDRAKLIESVNKKSIEEISEAQKKADDQREEALDARLDGYKRELDAQRELNKLVEDQVDMMRGLFKDMIGDKQPGTDKASGPTSAIEQIRDYFSDSSAITIGIDTLTEAFQGLGQAIGEVVQAWVLYGSAGQSVRQVTAQILAGIAQQAAIKAVFELAEGFAALAMAFFGIPNAGPSAAAHFTAAAMYGAIAGVAAIAGRAVAGDSFKQGSAKGGSRSPGSVAGGNDDGFTDQRRNPNDFRDRGNIFQAQSVQLGRLTVALGEVVETNRMLRNHVSGMKPGDVLAIGTKQNPRAVTNALNNDYARGGRATERTAKVTGRNR
jgi:hypothetical protein